MCSAGSRRTALPPPLNAARRPRKCGPDRQEPAIQEVEKCNPARHARNLRRPSPRRQTGPNTREGLRARVEPPVGLTHMKPLHRGCAVEIRPQLRGRIGNVEKIHRFRAALASIMTNLRPAKWARTIVIDGQFPGVVGQGEPPAHMTVPTQPEAHPIHEARDASGTRQPYSAYSAGSLTASDAGKGV